MPAKPLPDIETLKSILSYSPDTGALTWKIRPEHMFDTITDCENWNKRHAGNKALSTSNVHKYKYGRIGSQIYKAHRVAWAIHYGEEPRSEIDHINRDRSDNRIENLRAVSPSENSRNRKIKSTNKSGKTGVYWNSRQGKWHSGITYRKKRFHLGFYDNVDEAIKARKEAEIEHQYHPNHGTK